MPAPSSLPACFKAYDIRGRVPEELDPDLAYRIGLAFAAIIKPRRVVIGCDIRLSSPELSAALAQGLQESGVEVLKLGLCGTEELYFVTAHLKADGGIMVTASHNPADYNGMKLVQSGARPISGDSGLNEIGALAVQLGQEGRRLPRADPAEAPEPLNGCRHIATDQGGREVSGHGVPQVAASETVVRAAYIEHLLGYIEPARLKPLTIVANPGNGGAGAVLDALANHLPFTFKRLQWEPDGRFPHGVPNPLLPENRAITAQAVREHQADLGLAWDGDFDRCFFFDEAGNFIEGYYLVGLLAETLLVKNPGGKIIHDPRLVWNTEELVRRAGGIPVMAKTGHAFIKERMRREDAVYGGEMSAHHYFRDFFYCDSGMIPWLLVTELLSRSGKSLGQLVATRQEAFPVSGEINRKIADPAAATARVKAWSEKFSGSYDYTDGVSFSSSNFRFNLRSSNTEPLLRLNVETRGDKKLLAQITHQLLALIDQAGSVNSP